MKQRVQSTVTAGVAMVGASVVALTPVTAPPTSVARVSDVSVNLMASPIETLGGGIGQSVQNLGISLAAGPLGALTIAQALGNANANTNNILYLTLQAYIDSPLYVVDPALAAVDDVLPAPLGGGTGNFQTSAPDSGVEAFRLQYLYAARTAVRAVVAGALGVNPVTGADLGTPSPIATLALGVGGSATRLVQSLALLPLAPASVAAGVAAGKPFNQALYEAVRNVIDGPLWVADPTIDAIANVLPRALGGGTDGVHEVSSAADGAVINFRDNVLWRATQAVRTPIRDILGAQDPVALNPNARAAITTSTTTGGTTGTPAPQDDSTLDTAKPATTLDASVPSTVLDKSNATKDAKPAATTPKKPAQHRAPGGPISSALKNFASAVNKVIQPKKSTPTKKADEPKKADDSAKPGDTKTDSD